MGFFLPGNGSAEEVTYGGKSKGILINTLTKISEAVFYLISTQIPLSESLF